MSEEIENWEVVYTSDQQSDAAIIAAKLEAAGLRPVVLNQSDSSYPILGQVRVLVSPEEFESAMLLISAADGSSS